MKLIISFIVTFTAAALGAYFTSPSINTWYASLNKPFFNPPNWVFGPVWTLLYILMAVALYLVWKKEAESREKLKAVILYTIQLTLNALWSVVFFGMREPTIALAEIVFLGIAVILTAQSFKKISVGASRLLIPYIIWIGFAAILNLSIVVLN
ncbi:MAG: Integral membrane protein [candidate division WWE3 bacterium GW2011_GWB2_43_22]|uniref:Integral membrane protein n=1 Tax=candidate division WWE3 bacterium GW2011_GWB2_43_22 TaxID=1619118 RepID=A0A0G1ENQ0_UNCKA|nr:MAG: Integral membrane protein [candidate division WWE3 bacterium GW2011_GWB2_43_22]